MYYTINGNMATTSIHDSRPIDDDDAMMIMASRDGVECMQQKRERKKSRPGQSSYKYEVELAVCAICARTPMYYSTVAWGEKTHFLIVSCFLFITVAIYQVRTDSYQVPGTCYLARVIV